MCNDYYNKQIFDAVEHINMPDALGTRCYIYRSNELCGIYIVIWIKAEMLIEEIWYAVFFSSGIGINGYAFVPSLH